MILTCYDCSDERHPDVAKRWRYPCDECASAFVAKHREMGHEIVAREEKFSDKYLFSAFAGN